MPNHLSALKRLCAYYLRHHVEGFEGLEEEFIDHAANEIWYRLPDTDIEQIRPFMINGNVNEWIPLGQAIDIALNPSPDTVWTPDGTVELERMGVITSISLDGKMLAMTIIQPNGYVEVARVGAYGQRTKAANIREACTQVTKLYALEQAAKNIPLP